MGKVIAALSGYDGALELLGIELALIWRCYLLPSLRASDFGHVGSTRPSNHNRLKSLD
jgi:hypothetical protein